MSKKLLFALLCVFIIPVNLTGQKNGSDVPLFRDRLFFGGNFGLQLGTITDISVSPIIGYWAFPRIAVAAGPQYRFYKYFDSQANIVGGKAYAELYVIQDLNNVVPVGMNWGIFMHLEDEALRVFPGHYEDDFSINTVLVGGGISQPIGARSSMNMMALWAVDGAGYEYYSNPEIRIVFIF